MTPAIKWVYLVTLAVWVGSIVFLSFVQAPTVFRVLKPEDAAALQRATFPKYYMVGIGCAVVGIVCVAILLAAQVLKLPVAILSWFLLAGMGAASVWMRQGVAPQMAQVREQRAVAAPGSQELAALEADWKSLHRLSVQVNGAVLLAGLALLFVLVYAKAV
jgi:hypothetical protein